MALKAGVMAVVAGVLLLATGATGSTLLFDQIGDLVEERFPDAARAVEITLTVLSFLASLGGLAVIIGGALMLVGKKRVGRLVVLVSAVMALVGFVVQVLVVLDQGEGAGGFFVDVAIGINLAGIIVAFLARP